MMKWVLVFLIGCGPGLKPVPMSRDVLVGDAPKLRRLMRDSVANGGLVFDDAACTKDFGTPGEVPAEKLDAFARCLAGLHLEPSTREDTLPDVLVMQYAPGFEVQARVTNDDGAVLRWIGFASRVPGDLDVPTITHAAFEKQRLAGDPRAPLTPEAASTLGDDHASAWFKLCLDKAGAIVKVDPFVISAPKATHAFVEAIASWKFRPFVMRGTPIPVCSMVHLTHPVAQADVEKLPLPPPPSRSKKRPVVLSNSTLVEGKRISGTPQIFPNDLDKLRLQKSGNPPIAGVFRLCIDDTGAVESVLPIQLTGLAGYDQKIMSTMHDWKYAPYQIDGEAVPVCTQITFKYSQTGTPVRVEQH
jgi:hypothetical protein